MNNLFQEYSLSKALETLRDGTFDKEDLHILTMLACRGHEQAIKNYMNSHRWDDDLTLYQYSLLQDFDLY